MEEEIWKPVPGYEGLYEVSNMGIVKALAKTDTRGNRLKERVMKTRLVRGYVRIGLSKNNAQKDFAVHSLVWVSFNGPIPEGMQVNHINEDKTDNRLENLNLMTPKENCNWGTRNERRAKKQANRSDLSKSVGQYSKNGELINEYPSVRQAARETGLNQSNIVSCCLGRKYYCSVGGYVWRYVK